MRTQPPLQTPKVVVLRYRNAAFYPPGNMPNSQLITK